jgi:hypothetical protein
LTARLKPRPFEPPRGLKAARDDKRKAACGTTEVVPCYKAKPKKQLMGLNGPTAWCPRFARRLG